MIPLPEHARVKNPDSGDFKDGGHKTSLIAIDYAGAPTTDFDSEDTAAVGTKFRKYSIVRNTGNNKLYMCHDASVGLAVWVELGGAGGGGTGLAYWSSGVEYAVDDTVVYGGYLWRCLALHTSGASFDITKFSPLSPSVRKVNSAGHGLVVKDVVRISGAGYVKAKADVETTVSNPPTIVWMVSGDNYIVVTGGTLVITGHGFTVGETYYTSEATAGAVTITSPSISNAIFTVVDANTVFMFWGGGSGGTSMKVNQPLNTAPSSGETGVILSPVLSANDFATLPLNADTHQMSDWEVATDSGFVTVVASSYSDTVNLESWTVGSALATNTQHWFRVRYQGAGLGWSKWSDGTSFTTRYIVTPTGTTPAGGATGVAILPTLNSSAFASSPAGQDTHASSDWEVATDVGFTNVIASSYDGTVNKTSWVVDMALSPLTSYYYRVRHTGTGLGDSSWSAGVSFTTGRVNQASNSSPLDAATGVMLQGPLVSSAFATTPAVCDTHLNSDWEVYSDSGLITKVASSYANTVSLTSWSITPQLSTLSQYWWRVRHRGNSVGTGAWSTVTRFTTTDINVNSPTITSPTEGATGVGLTPTITTSAFSTTPAGQDTHSSSDWEVATDAGFVTVVASSYGDTVNKTSWTVDTALTINTTYYVRVRHTGDTYTDNGWSATVSFTTVNISVNTTSVTSPTEGATGVSRTPTITTSAFSTTPAGQDTHLNSDWEVATDAGFVTVVASSYASTANKTSWTVGTTLALNTTYYVRARHRGTTYGDNGWSTTVSFTTVNIIVNTPSVTAPTDNAVNVGYSPTITASTFATTPAGQDTHLNSDWEVATDAGFVTVVASSYNNTTNKTSWVVNATLANNTTHYVRTRQRGNIYGTSAWSNTITFIVNITVNQATITSPSNGATGLSRTPTITTGAFATTPSGQDTHLNSDWEISSNSGFTAIVASSYASTTNKTSWVVGTNLANNTTYYVRARHRGTTYGAGAWSATISFTTANFTPPPSGTTYTIDISSGTWTAPGTGSGSYTVQVELWGGGAGGSIISLSGGNGGTTSMFGFSATGGSTSAGTSSSGESRSGGSGSGGTTNYSGGSGRCGGGGAATREGAGGDGGYNSNGTSGYSGGGGGESSTFAGGGGGGAGKNGGTGGYPTFLGGTGNGFAPNGSTAGTNANNNHTAGNGGVPGGGGGKGEYSGGIAGGGGGYSRKNVLVNIGTGYPYSVGVGGSSISHSGRTSGYGGYGLIVITVL